MISTFGCMIPGNMSCYILIRLKSVTRDTDSSIYIMPIKLVMFSTENMFTLKIIINIMGVRNVPKSEVVILEFRKQVLVDLPWGKGLRWILDVRLNDRKLPVLEYVEINPARLGAKGFIVHKLKQE